MQYDTMAVVIRTTIGLLGVVAVVQFVLLPTFVAEFRQRLFALRRRLFMLMADGNIRPEDPAYVRLRNSLNGLIRSAERVTFLRVLLLGALLVQPTKQHRANDEAAIEAIPSENARKQIRALRDEMGDLVLQHIIVTSPIALSLLALLLVFVLLAAAWKLATKAKSGILVAMRRLVMKKLRERIPTDTIGAEEELWAENAAIA